MKLLFCTHDFDSGGSARSLAILLEHLAQRHEITLISTIRAEKTKNQLKRYNELGVKSIYFPWGWLPVNLVGCRVVKTLHERRCVQLSKLIPEIQKIAQDMDAVCFNGYPSSNMASIFPAHIPKYLIAREVLEENSPDFSLCAAFLHKHIKKAIAIGPVESAQLQSMDIPNEIVFNTGKSAPEFAHLPEAPPIHVGVFTQFVPSKGLDTLALAVNLSAHVMRNMAAIIHIFGGSPDGYMTPLENEIRDFVRTNDLADIIKFEGWTNDAEAMMKPMHCIVRPDATGSPWGRDVIEAMSMGRPVIATGSNEVFVKNGSTGWLVPPKDPPALATALANLATHRQLLGYLARNSFEFAAKNFDPEINMSRIERIVCGDD